MRKVLTDRLYYRDPALLEFDATILSSVEQDGRFVTTLDRSAFYPTSGGQLFDTGTLNSVRVVDVSDLEGSVHHISETSVGKPGDPVAGKVDQDRRRMHRQQHTAQHILSQSFIKLFGFETVSVHLGDDYGSIELDQSSITAAQLDQVERFAADVVSFAWPVTILFVMGNEIESIPLRKIPTRDGELRVIKIGEFDYSACGGTHCGNTSEVGLIKITGWEKLRGHALVNFLAGVQAVEDYKRRFEATDALSKSLTCGVSDLVGKVDKLAAEGKSLRKALAALQKELLPTRVAHYAGMAIDVNGRKLVFSAIEDMDGATAGQLGSAVAEEISGVALLVADGKLLIAVGQGTGLHAGEIAKSLSAILGLRGGGSNKAAQLGGADPAKLQEYQAALLSIIGHA